MTTDFYDVLDDKDIMNTLVEAAKSKDFDKIVMAEAFDKLVEEVSVRKALNKFILDCRKYSSDNKEKCEVCNLRFTCYTTK